jgi:hypothetical protein
VYQIGDELLLEISGLPDFTRSRLEVVERPGVDGSGVWDTGKRGQRCIVRTQVDAEDLTAAIETFHRYCELVDSDPVNITYAGVSLSSYGVLFQVCDVRPVLLTGIAGGSGGLNPPSLGWVTCDWELLPIPAAE